MIRIATVTMMVSLLLAPGFGLAEEADSWGDPESLEGKPAPDLGLSLLGGGELDLAAYKGKKAVVLEFWATWCPWCRQSTAKFDSLAKQYAEEDVEFFIVNVAEEPETIKKYLDEHSIKTPIALDPERKVSDRYWVDYIPHTVIIGKDGVVQRVDIGKDKVAEGLTAGLKKLFDASESE